MSATLIQLLVWIEQSALGVWVAESSWGFPIAITLHAFGMGFLAGGNIAIALRLLGAAPGVPLPSLLRLYPFLWCSAVLSVISGVMLLSAYPAKALTNPLFYCKLALICVGLWLLTKPVRAVLQEPFATAHAKRWGWFVLLVWLATITAGRFLAYTHHVLTASELLMGG